MAWLSRNNLTPSDYLIADFLNSLANDDRNWGGDVNGGGYKLTNVILSGSGGFLNVLSPMEIVPGSDSMSRVQLDQIVATVPTARWSLQKNATAEGGANAGSDFQIVRFNDAGAILGPALTVLRANGHVAIGNTAAVLPDSTAGIRLIVGDTTGALQGRIAMGCVQSVSGTGVGQLAFANYAIAAADKRIVSLSGVVGGAIDSGDLAVSTWNAGVGGERMRVTAAGSVGIGTATVSAGAKLAVIGGDIDLAEQVDGRCIGFFTTETGGKFAAAASGGLNLARYGSTYLGGARNFGVAISGWGGLRFFTTDVERFSILATNGNVGINTATPACLLDVSGCIRATGTGVSPTAGAGLEISYAPGLNWARILAYDRSAGVYKDIRIGTANGVQLAVNANNTVTIGDSANPCNLGVGTASASFKVTVSGGGAAEGTGGSLFTPSINWSNSLCITDTAPAVWAGGALILGKDNLNLAAMRVVYNNGTGFGTGELCFYTRPVATTEAMALALRITTSGVLVNPTMPTANPGAGTKALWADPADGYRVKFAA
jgi:hypothetical protein